MVKRVDKGRQLLIQAEMTANPDEDIALTKKAAAEGDPVALAWCQLYGWGVPMDETAAVAALAALKQDGDPAAANALGICYREGWGVTKNLRWAYKLFKLAVDSKFERAKTNLGYAYAVGEGVEKDLDRAVELFAEAAAAGCNTAKYKLGWAFKLGTVLPKNLDKAADYFLDSNDPEASGSFDDLPKKVRTAALKRRKLPRGVASPAAPAATPRARKAAAGAAAAAAAAAATSAAASAAKATKKRKTAPVAEEIHQLDKLDDEEERWLKAHQSKRRALDKKQRSEIARLTAALAEANSKIEALTTQRESLSADVRNLVEENKQLRNA